MILARILNGEEETVVEGEEEGEEAPLGSAARGVLNAPVLWRWSFSKISCSSFGRRGGEGPLPKGGGGGALLLLLLLLWRWEGDVLKNAEAAWVDVGVRRHRERWRGRRVRAVRCIFDGIMGENRWFVRWSTEEESCSQ